MNFALVGAAGFVAPRHLQAIADVGARLVAAMDPHDSVGILDRYDRSTAFFTESWRFERYLLKLQRGGSGIDWMSVCSPNYLHEDHVRLGMRVGANVICEKPLTLSPWNLDALEQHEQQTGRRVFTVLQLRHVGALRELRENVRSHAGRHHVVLRYVTPRGPWYHRSWKGDEAKSGGLVTNIGIHMLDVLLWVFGPCVHASIDHRSRTTVDGHLVTERADVDWTLSIDGDAPDRTLEVDGQDVPFGEGFSDLHAKVYLATLKGEGTGISDARPSVELAYRLRMMV